MIMGARWREFQSQVLIHRNPVNPSDFFLWKRRKHVIIKNMYMCICDTGCRVGDQNSSWEILSLLGSSHFWCDHLPYPGNLSPSCLQPALLKVPAKGFQAIRWDLCPLAGRCNIFNSKKFLLLSYLQEGLLEDTAGEAITRAKFPQPPQELTLGHDHFLLLLLCVAFMVTQESWCQHKRGQGNHQLIYFSFPIILCLPSCASRFCCSLGRHGWPPALWSSKAHQRTI